MTEARNMAIGSTTVRLGGEAATAVVGDLILQSEQGVPSRPEPVGFGAEAMALAAEIGDVPSPRGIRPGRTRQGCLLANKNDSCR